MTADAIRSPIATWARRTALPLVAIALCLVAPLASASVRVVPGGGGWRRGHGTTAAFTLTMMGSRRGKGGNLSELHLEVRAARKLWIWLSFENDYVTGV